VQGMMTEKPRSGFFRSKTAGYMAAVLMVLVITFVGKALKPPFDLINIILLYLLPVLASAVWWGLWPSIFASFLGVLSFDFFFIPPVWSFSVAHVRYFLDFLLFLILALVTGSLASRLRSEAEVARDQERRAAALYSFSQKIAGTTVEEILQLVVRTIASNFDGEAAILLPGAPFNEVTLAVWSGKDVFTLTPKERSTAQLVFEHERPLQFDKTQRLHFLPITDGEHRIGVLAFLSHELDGFSPELQKDLASFMPVTALAITRANFVQDAQKAKVLAESEKLHRSLLNAVSHDLRTPLSSIMGAVTGLLSQGDHYGTQDKETLLETIREGALRMNRFITNLLDMARLESGMLRLNKSWCDLVDIIGSALQEGEDLVSGKHIHLDYPDTLPLVEVDAGLIQQVLINLFENARKYSADRGIVGVSISFTESDISVAVEDDAPPIPELERDRIFDRFYRIHSSIHPNSTGLGLSICKGFIEAHGGKIRVEIAETGGNRFIFSLPITDQPQILDASVNAGGEV
jgi:two-component system, OmpR family, sensor histidine kinase KdpD